MSVVEQESSNQRLNNLMVERSLAGETDVLGLKYRIVNWPSF